MVFLLPPLPGAGVWKNRKTGRLPHPAFPPTVCLSVMRLLSHSSRQNLRISGILSVAPRYLYFCVSSCLGSRLGDTLGRKRETEHRFGGISRSGCLFPSTCEHLLLRVHASCPRSIAAFHRRHGAPPYPELEPASSTSYFSSSTWSERLALLFTQWRCCPSLQGSVFYAEVFTPTFRDAILSLSAIVLPCTQARGRCLLQCSASLWIPFFLAVS